MKRSKDLIKQPLRKSLQYIELFADYRNMQIMSLKFTFKSPKAFCA